MKEEIKAVIHGYNDKEAEYSGGLSNHLNMGLYALYKMGAKSERLHEYAKQYIKQNNIREIKPIKYRINHTNFMNYIGGEDTYSSFVLFFEQYVSGFGIEETLKRYLNILIKGSAGAAFHGLIRLSYAILLSDKEEIVKAMAYMAQCYKAFSPAGTMLITDDPVARITKLSQNRVFKNFGFEASLIISRMQEVYEEKEFQLLATALDMRICDMESITEAALKLYGMTENFTMLHGLTSTHGLGVLAKYLDYIDEVINLHWFHLQLAYLSTGCTKLHELPTEKTVQTWEEIFERTIQVEDVHTIKLIFSLSELAKEAKDDQLHRTLAVRRLTAR